MHDRPNHRFGPQTAFHVGRCHLIVAWSVCLWILWTVTLSTFSLSDFDRETLLIWKNTPTRSRNPTMFVTPGSRMCTVTVATLHCGHLRLCLIQLGQSGPCYPQQTLYLRDLYPCGRPATSVKLEFGGTHAKPRVSRATALSSATFVCASECLQPMDCPGWAQVVTKPAMDASIVRMHH